jgi:hypothetical protein
MTEYNVCYLNGVDYQFAILRAVVISDDGHTIP